MAVDASSDPEPDLSFCRKLVLFFEIHWRGLVILLTPLVAMCVLYPFPPQHYQWCAYTLVVMAVWWMTECLPLPVTSFLPVVIFPLTGVMDTRTTCKCYVNDTILMFIGSLIIAAAVESSGLHMRLALQAMRCIGYSHYRLLFALTSITMFISMWISNTAATSMMVPINFAVLEVFEGQKMLSVYDTDIHGDKQASDLTTCYFCAATYSATIGGIGTLVGTVTNLAFKGLFAKQYPDAPEYLSFPLFSAFTLPYMLLLQLSMYLYLIIIYFGFLRPKSKAAERAKMTAEAIKATKAKVDADYKALGRCTFNEIMVSILFVLAILLFFSRSPLIFPGWGDIITKYFGQNTKFVLDTVPACMISFMVFLIPANLDFFKNCTVKTKAELPKGRIQSMLKWTKTRNTIPISFIFLLGGGFALSTAAGKKYSDLNGRIGDFLSMMKNLPDAIIVLILIIFTIFITNFASNVAVANVVCPIAMSLASKINKNPLKYCLTCGLVSSYCYILPVGTAGNLIVQSAASIPTSKMMVAGIGPTLTSIVWTWIFALFWSPIIWPDINTLPKWATS